MNRFAYLAKPDLRSLRDESDVAHHDGCAVLILENGLGDIFDIAK